MGRVTPCSEPPLAMRSFTPLNTSSFRAARSGKSIRPAFPLEAHPSPLDRVESAGVEGLVGSLCETRAVKVLKHLQDAVPTTISRSSLAAVETLPSTVL